MPSKTVLTLAETPFCRCPLLRAPEFRRSPYTRSCTVMMVQICLPPLTTCYVRHLFNTSLKSRVSSSGPQKQSAAHQLHVYCNRQLHCTQLPVAERQLQLATAQTRHQITDILFRGWPFCILRVLKGRGLNSQSGSLTSVRNVRVVSLSA